MVKIVVTGAGGRIAYHVLFRLLSSNWKDLEIIGYDLPAMQQRLQGLLLETEDCAASIPIKMTSSLEEAFRDVDIALLIGAKPRGEGMERQDLLRENARIFVEVGEALNRYASRDVKVLVVGNPCNTNCLITMMHAPLLPRMNFHAMVSLDALRTKAQLAHQLCIAPSDIACVSVWGNHSSTQVPDLIHAHIQEHPAKELLDEEWYRQTLIPRVQKRGSEIIKTLGSSSIGSAAHAIMTWLEQMFTPTREGEFFASAVYSQDNPYGIDPHLIFGFPLISDGKGHVRIQEGLDLPSWFNQAIKQSEHELIEEREMVQQVLSH